MKQTTLFIFCLLAMAFGAESAASQVTRADYERADTILKCSDRVYSPAIHPEWIDSSHYFWYKNHEKEGDFYYLVNAESGKKQRAADKKGLAAFFSKSKETGRIPAERGREEAGSLASSRRGSGSCCLAR